MTRSRTATALFSGLFAALMAGAPALAQSEGATVGTRGDRDWITISGSVAAVHSDSFTLDYGEGTIRVEMDDFRKDTPVGVRPQEKVKVTGTLDDDVFETRTIEASSVYMQNRDAIYYASPLDEEGGRWTVPAPGPIVDAEVGITGVVVARDGNALVLDTGRRTLTVDMSDLVRVPDVQVGQRISVLGETEDQEVDIFEARAMKAGSVTILSPG